jgi:c-di-GMP-binding flagellar brake protein YcgR
MPAYPSVPIPKSRGEAPLAKKLEKATPKPALKPAPKTAPDRESVESQEPIELPVKTTPKKEAPKPLPAKKNWPKFRRFIRVPIKAKVSVQGHGSFEVFNISESGVFLKASDPLEIGTDVKLSLEAEIFENKIDMTGIVIRLTEESAVKGFAVEFTRLNPAHKRALQAYVQKYCDENPL